MSHSGTISDSVFSVAALLRAGDVRTARRQWRATLASADEQECAVLAECGRILAAHPNTATTRLRDLWRRSDERARAVIAACAPTPGEHRPRREPEPDHPPRWTRANRYQAPSTVHHEIRPELRRPRQQRQTREDSAITRDYLHDRAGVDDAPERGPRPDGYAIDYDNAAKHPVRGRPCIALGCHLEPSNADRAHRDGLCQECRELDRPGIPSLPEGATRAQAIEALCTYIHQHYPHPVEHLRTEWHRYDNQTDRDTVAAWVTANMTTPAATQPAGSELATCQQCGDDRHPRDMRHLSTDDGVCAECRTLDTVPVQVRASSAAPGEPTEERSAALVA